MKIKPEPVLHLATALVSAAAPFFLDAITAGLALAAISVAHAVNATLSKVHYDQTPLER